MTSISPDSLLAQMQWRYATKQFDATRTIPADVWGALEKALILTPSSFGMQPWKFLVVTDPAIKQALVPVSWNQTQPVECSHHVVFAANTNVGEAEIDQYLASMAATRGVTVESLAGFRGVLAGFAGKAAKEGWVREWATRQVYIALGNFMTSAAMLGIDTCPMEGIAPAEYDKVLGLEGTGFATVVACAAGYRASTDKYASLPKVRFPAGEIIKHI